MFLGIILVSVQTKQLLKEAQDAHLYRWGVIYINPEDDRLWVPKRLGMGLTLNFAKPIAKWIMLLILLIPISVVTLVATLGRH